MPQNKIYDSPHQRCTINNWIKYGLILKEGETYKDIYYYVMSIDNCQLCSVKFNDVNFNDKRCMDHDHSSGYFRQVLLIYQSLEGTDLTSVYDASRQLSRTSH